MKDATGELNMTVVTVVAIAAIATFFYVIIWPGIKASIQASTYCSSAVNCDKDRKQCHYYMTDDSGKMQISTDTIDCSKEESSSTK